MELDKSTFILEIRKMNAYELHIYFQNFLSLFAENTRGHVIDQEIKDEYIEYKARELFSYLENNHAVLFGAFHNNVLIGFLWAYPRVFLEEKRMYINSLIISEKFRGSGCGRLLLDAIEKHALDHGIFAIDVTTASFKTDAIYFYEKNGYKHERVQLRKSL